MGLRGGPHNGEAETGAALAVPFPAARVIEPGEAAEGSLRIVWRDAGAIVGHGEPHARPVPGDSHHHLGPGVADSVLDEIAEHPAQPVGVPGHRIPLRAGRFLAGRFLISWFLAGWFLAGWFLAGWFLAGWFLAGRQQDRHPCAIVPADLGPGQSGQVDLLVGAAAAIPLVESGEHQQILGQPGQPEGVR
jgi:hypothetical protein